MVKLLIEARANVDLSDRKENSPLHWATQKGFTEIVEILLKANANPNAVNNQVEFCLFFSSQFDLFSMDFQGFDTVTFQYNRKSF